MFCATSRLANSASLQTALKRSAAAIAARNGANTKFTALQVRPGHKQCTLCTHFILFLILNKWKWCDFSIWACSILILVVIYVYVWISLTFSVEPTVDNRRFGRLLHPVIQNEQVFRDDADAVNVGNDRPRHDVEGREGKKSINASKLVTFSSQICSSNHRIYAHHHDFTRYVLQLLILLQRLCRWRRFPPSSCLSSGPHPWQTPSSASSS